MGRRLQLQRVSSWLPCREYSTGVVAKNLHFHLQVGGRKKGSSPGVGFWKSQIPPQTLNASQNNSTHQEPRNQIEIGGGGQFHSNYYFPPLKKLSNTFAHLSQIETNSQVEPQGPFAVSCFDSNLSSLLPHFLVFLGSGSLVNYMDSILILIKCFPGSPLWTPASPCLLDSGTEKKNV